MKPQKIYPRIRQTMPLPHNSQSGQQQSWHYHLSIRVLLLLVLCLILTSATPRRLQLERERKRLLQEIQKTEAQLRQLRGQETQLMALLQTLSAQIREREQLLAILQEEQHALRQEINWQTDLIQALASDLDKLRARYADLLRALYRYHILRRYYPHWLPVLWLRTPRQAYLFTRYLQALTRYRHEQAELIRDLTHSLYEQLQILNSRKAQLDSLVYILETQRQEYLAARKEHEQILKQLQRKERTLKKAIERKRRRAQALQKAIEEAIRRELELAKKRAQEQKQRTTSTSTGSASPLERARGQLPWPAPGILVERFGVRPHPVLKHVKIKNNGIDIQTEGGTPVRAVYDGTVTSIFQSSLFGYAVLIRHGQYYTVYSGLERVTVRSGQTVSQGTILGYLPNQEKLARLHFELWRGTTPLNPEEWLTSRP